MGGGGEGWRVCSDKPFVLASGWFVYNKVSFIPVCLTVSTFLLCFPIVHGMKVSITTSLVFPQIYPFFVN